MREYINISSNKRMTIYELAYHFWGRKRRRYGSVLTWSMGQAITTLEDMLQKERKIIIIEYQDTDQVYDLGIRIVMPLHYYKDRTRAMSLTTTPSVTFESRESDEVEIELWRDPTLDHYFWIGLTKNGEYLYIYGRDFKGERTA